MDKGFKFYRQLFLSTLQLSAFTFGGGFVIVPLMKKKFVDEFHWIEEDEMMDITAIAQSSPGAIAVNASILVGYKVAGIIGAIISMIGTVLPPLVILSIISLFYNQFRDSEVVAAVMKGMQAGVGAIIVDVVFNMGTRVYQHDHMISPILMIIAFVATYLFNVNIIVIILVCGIIGAIRSLIGWEVTG